MNPRTESVTRDHGVTTSPRPAPSPPATDSESAGCAPVDDDDLPDLLADPVDVVEWRTRAACKGLGREMFFPMPADEQAARAWHCRRCGAVGFDPNRGARAWHTPETCDEKVGRLDRVLDDSPGERPPWELGW